MDENLHRIDDLFKKALDEHAETPSPKVWENLDKNLEKKKVVSITKKYRKWKWVAAALFIFSCSMAMYTWNLKLRYKEVARKNRSKTTNTTRSDRQQVNGKASDTSTAGNIYKDLTSGTPDGKTAIVTDTAKAKRNEIEKAGSTAAEVPVEKASEPGVNTKRQINVAETGNTKETPKAPGRKQDNNATKDNMVPIDHFNSTVKRNKTTSALAKDVAIADQFKKVEPSIAGTQKNLSEFKVPAIAQNDKPTLSSKQNFAEQNTKAANTKISQQGLYTVTFFVSGQRVSTNLKDDRPRFREDDRREIKQRENLKFSRSVGVLIGRDIGNGLSVQAGVSVVTRVTDIDSKKIFARPDSRGNVNYRISCSSGYAYVTTKTGTAPASGDSISSLSTATTLQYMSVPLGLQYHLRAGSFTISPTVAVAANFKTRGKIETVLKAPGGNEKANTNIEGLKSSYFDGSVRMDLAYDFTKTIGLTLMPAARFGLSSITSGAPVKTHVNSLGIGLGLNVHF